MNPSMLSANPVRGPRAANLVIGSTETYLLVHALYSRELVEHEYGVPAEFSRGSVCWDDPNTPIFPQPPLLALLQKIPNVTAETEVPLLYIQSGDLLAWVCGVIVGIPRLFGSFLAEAAMPRDLCGESPASS